MSFQYYCRECEEWFYRQAVNINEKCPICFKYMFLELTEEQMRAGDNSTGEDD